MYEDYGIKMLSNVVACKRSTIEKRPELCRAFVEGMMEGLKYVYLNPEEALKIHLDSVAEFKNANAANQKVIEYGQAVSTSLEWSLPSGTTGLGSWIRHSWRKPQRRWKPTWGGETTLCRKDVHESIHRNREAGVRRVASGRSAFCEVCSVEQEILSWSYHNNVAT